MEENFHFIIIILRYEIPMTLSVRHQENKDSLSTRCWHKESSRKASSDKVRNRITKQKRHMHCLPKDAGDSWQTPRYNNITIITIISHTRQERQQVFMVSLFMTREEKLPILSDGILILKGWEESEKDRKRNVIHLSLSKYWLVWLVLTKEYSRL